jgi:hypothetical protein
MQVSVGIPVEWKAVSETYLDTLALREGHPGLILSNHKDVGFTSGEGVINRIFNVDDVETTIMALTVSDDTDPTHVATTSDHADDTGVETDKVGDLACSQVDLDGVIDLD